jgi:hypothetical protein
MEMACVLKSVFNHVNLARNSLRIAFHAQFFPARLHHRMVSNVPCLVSMRLSLQQPRAAQLLKRRFADFELTL